MFRRFYIFLFSLILLSVLFDEVHARRKILKGRKTVTREYYKAPLLPPWAKIVLVGVGLLCAGAIVYGIAWKIVIHGTGVE